MPRKPPLKRPASRQSKMVDRPEDFDLHRRPEDQSPDRGIRSGVLASMLLGVPVSQIAAQYNLPSSTIQRWYKDYDITSPINRRDRLGENLVVWIEQEIKNLISISIVTSDEDWIKDQSAAELADYVQVKASALMQVFAAFGKSSAQGYDLRQNQNQLEVLDPDE